MHHVQDLESHLFGNPHSQHGWSGNEGSATAVAEARQLTLDMCNAPLGQYECIFTSGATGQQTSTAPPAVLSKAFTFDAAQIVAAQTMPAASQHIHGQEFLCKVFLKCLMA